jgi:AcrR family transcriptional regulator
MPRLPATERREQLIRTAATVFARHGYDGATTAAIAAAAGITEPVLYRHFESKQALFAAIVGELLDKLSQRWQAVATAGTDAVQQLRLAAAEYGRAITDLPDFYRVLNGAILTSQDHAVQQLIQDYYRKTEQHLSSLIERGQQQGVFRDDIGAQELAWTMIDMGIGYAVQETSLAPGRLRPAIFLESVLSMLRLN